MIAQGSAEAGRREAPGPWDRRSAARAPNPHASTSRALAAGTVHVLGGDIFWRRGNNPYPDTTARQSDLTSASTAEQPQRAMPTPCSICESARALVKRPKTGQQVCKQCFFDVFETEVHETITTSGDNGGSIFEPGERVAIGASGGKGGCCPRTCCVRRPDSLTADSTVLAHVLTTLNERYNYGLDLHLLSIDEGIKGYRDDSLEVSSPCCARVRAKLTNEDCEAEPGRVWTASQDPIIRRAVRVDYGSSRGPGREEEQLHFLRCIQAPSSGPWRRRSWYRPHRDGAQRR